MDDSQEISRTIAKRKQGAGSLFRDASQRSWRNRWKELWTHSSVPAASLTGSALQKFRYIFSALRFNDRVIASFSIFCSLGLATFCIEKFEKLHSIIHITK